MFQARLFLLCCALLASAPALAGIDVRVRGLGSDEEDNAFAQLRILDYAKGVDASKGSDKIQYDPAEVERLAKQGEEDIRKALQPFGWYNPVISSKLEGKEPDWTVTYQVNAGPETDIGKIDILIAGEGKDYAALQKIVARPRLKTGERLKHQDYEGLKARLIQAANSGGFLGRRVQPPRAARRRRQQQRRGAADARYRAALVFRRGDDRAGWCAQGQHAAPLRQDRAGRALRFGQGACRPSLP